MEQISDKSPESRESVTESSTGRKWIIENRPRFSEISQKYGLNLDDEWNKDLLPHIGRHPNAYHEWVLEQMRIIDNMLNMNQQQFINQFEIRVKQPIRNNPDML
ncbi:MAG: AHH domain-containing protein [Prevotella sp.]|nr:AHH domain-containing protein [Prevotella sp.]